MGVEEFCRVVRQDEATVLRYEPIVLRALRFDLLTYAPYRSLAGFFIVRPQ